MDSNGLEYIYTLYEAYSGRLPNCNWLLQKSRNLKLLLQK